MPAAGLSIADVVSVSVTLAPVASPTRNFGTLLILGATDVIDTVERLREYTTSAGVVADFGSTAPEYLAAAEYFAQAPQPAVCYIGRWAKTATAGVLHGGAFTSTTAQNALLTALQAVSAGTMTITIDGTARALTGLDFHAIANLNAAATVIGTTLTQATVTWNATQGRFEVKSKTTGAASTVGYAAPQGTGTDVSAMLQLTAASGASVPAAGIVSEQPIAAVQACTSASGDWYGCTIADASVTDNQHAAVAAFVESASPSRIYGVTTQEAGVVDPTSTTDVAYVLSNARYRRSAVQYSSSSPYATASLLGRAFTVDFTANNTTITLKFKNEPGVSPENLTETQATAVKAKHANVFAQYLGATAIIQEGVMADGTFFDEVHGLDWLQNNVQIAIWNLLATSPTKIPQTDPGIHMIATVIEAAIDQGVNNGLIAPGVWEGPPIGALQTGQLLTKGFYIFAPPIASQNQADREARKAPTMQAAIKLAGAVHSANVIINVNR